MHRSSVDIRRSLQGDVHFDTARGLVGLGETLIDLGQTEEATSILQEALAILAETGNDDHPEAERAAAALARSRAAENGPP